MPDDRLERTRHPQPTIPACVRLGHTYRVLLHLGVYECIRCGQQTDDPRRATPPDQPIRLSDTLTTEHWNTIEGEQH